MPLNPGLQLVYGIQPVNPLPVDSWSGPYTSVAEALSSVPSSVRFQSMEIRLIIGGVSKKYWFRDGIADTDLVEFSSSGSGGGSTGATGLDGATGPQGATGEQGPPGPLGNPSNLNTVSLSTGSEGLSMLGGNGPVTVKFDNQILYDSVGFTHSTTVNNDEITVKDKARYVLHYTVVLRETVTTNTPSQIEVIAQQNLGQGWQDIPWLSNVTTVFPDSGYERVILSKSVVFDSGVPNAKIRLRVNPITPGHSYVHVENGTVLYLYNVQGVVGPKGETGAIGATGLDGAIGETGLQGFRGPTGEKGNIGDTGDIGPTGPTGSTGATGPDGQGITDGYMVNNELILQFANGTTMNAGPLPKGETGADGATGEQGLPGPEGPKGETGSAGPKGSTG